MSTFLIQVLAVAYLVSLSLQDPVDPGEDCPGPSGAVTHYWITFQTVSFVISEITTCTAERCNHTFELPSNPPSSYDSMSVAAENVVGVGAARTCTTQTISELIIICTSQDAQVSLYKST